MKSNCLSLSVSLASCCCTVMNRDIVVVYCAWGFAMQQRRVPSGRPRSPKGVGEGVFLGWVELRFGRSLR